MEYRTLNPATEEIVERYPFTTEREIETALTCAENAFRTYAKLPLKSRLLIFKQIATSIENHRKEIGDAISLEMGRPRSLTESEAEKGREFANYLHDYGESFLSPARIKHSKKEAFLRFDPLGLVLAVLPWNYPFSLIMRSALPAIAGGNAVIVKPAPNTTKVAKIAQKILDETDLPKGIFQTLLLSNEQVENVLVDRRIAALTFTGSAKTGSHLASLAGKHIKRSVIELGGSDPFIVLSDADINKAGELAATSRCVNTGQICCGSKRFIVEEDVANQFTEVFVEKMAGKCVGDPFDPQTEMGPLAREDILQNIVRQVEKSIKGGSTLLCGGARLDRKGYFYPPTVLTNVSKSVPAGCEELFGPVGVIYRVKNKEEALLVANDTNYGLGASVHTSSRAHAEYFAENLEVGSVFINSLVSSSPELPFGGVKESGYGREWSEYGVKEFVNLKTVVF